MPRATRPRRGTGAVLLEFFGSMNLAITLLVVVAIAAVIGTVLQQNQPYSDYVFKFGPFWFEVFRELGLYDVYGAVWFIVLLGFLLVSTSVCIYRNAPTMVRDMRHFRLNVQTKSLRAFHHKEEWQADGGVDQVADKAQGLLTARGYRVRRQQREDGQILAAMKGSWNRLGYILSHGAIVVICIGGLLDGNLPLKVAEWTGRIEVETRDLPASAVPEKSTLSADNAAFRGNVRIPEGSTADFVFLNVRDGYLLQELPFKVELKDFRIEHYASGQPKSFESDLVVHDPNLDEPIEKTIAVNHPLTHNGYSIYQASFSDGGSRLDMKAWWLDAPEVEPLAIEGAVYEQRKLQTPRGQLSLELNDFKRFNIFPAPEDSGKKFQNYGASVTFKLRNPAGEAMEFTNYVNPVPMEGNLYYMSGVRGSPSESFKYLYIPADPSGGIERFMAFRARMQDPEAVRKAATGQIEELLPADAGETMKQQMTESVVRLSRVFTRGGMSALTEHVSGTVPEAERDQAMESYLLMLQGIYGSLYLEQLRDEGVDVAGGISDTDARFFDDALEAISVLANYGSPLFLQVTDYEHIEASGLQITRAPGQDVVYLGFVMLMGGVFFMFYVHHRRVWVLVSPNGSVSDVLVAGTGNRDRADFGKEFDELQRDFNALTKNSD